MGIPFYFANVVKTYPNVITTKPLKECGRLFLDFNSIIHMCTGAIMMSNPIVTPSNQDIFAKITNHVIDQICAHCTPKHLLYIAIDGVAPLAKIYQQRKRRFLTAYRNEMHNSWKKSKGIPISEWDSNCITPGTAFMKELDEYLKNYFGKREMGFDVIISGSDEPGEGEHKMIRYIREHPPLETHSDVIYGLDADLIMLSLSCNNKDMYLMRESSMISDLAQDLAYFKYINIDTFRESISEYNNGSYADYIALCFLLGNDFLPNIPFLKIKKGSLQTLLEIYNNIRSAITGSLVETNDETSGYKFNKEFLARLLESLAEIEDVEMKKTHDDWVSMRPRRSQGYDFTIDLENYPIKNSALRQQLSKSIDPTSPKWRAIYYNDIFGSRENEFIKGICERYLQGLQWTLDYYFNGKTQNSWYYEYGYAPTALDLFNTYMGDTNVIDTVFEKDIEIYQTQQLIMVLPPQSHSLIPANTLHSKYDYMFPVTFKIQIYLKQYLWECVPMLPNVTC